jgi:hypothetical protein
VDDPRTLLACALLPAVLAGCAAPNPSRDQAPSAALEDLAPSEPRQTGSSGDGPSLAEMARRAADDLNKGYTRPPTRDAPEPDGQPRPWQTRTEQGAGSAETQKADPPAAEPAGQPGPTEQATATPEVDPVELLLEHLEAQSADPERALAASLLAQAVRAYAGIDDGTRPGQSLSPPEREVVDLLGPLLEALAAGDRADAPARIGQAVTDVDRGLAEVLPVRIGDAALATDIYGFAAYKAFPTYAFQAGQTNRVLLYTEPTNFQSLPAAEPGSEGDAANPGAYEVVLGLELQLYNERGSMLAWRAPEERVVLRSDRPRREVYLGTMIDLPASLSVGRYQLKVIVRDHADGSEDERVIPIEIVADPRLTSRATRSR